MIREEILELVAEVQRHQSELEDVEVKSARCGEAAIPSGLIYEMKQFY